MDKDEKTLSERIEEIIKSDDEAADKFKQVSTELADSMEKNNEAVKNASKTADDATTEVEGIKTEYADAKAEWTKNNEAMQTQLDELETEAKRAAKEGPKTKANPFKVIFEGDEHKALIEFGTRWKQQLNIKAADMTTTNTYTDDVIEPDRIKPIVFAPDRAVHIRQIIPMGNTIKDVVSFPRETAIDDGTATRAESAAMGQTDVDISEIKINVENISAFARLSREMLDDTDFLQSYLTGRLMSKLMVEEDSQLLTGDGVSPNLDGLITQATAATDNFEDANVGRFDILAGAGSQCKIANFVPNWMVIHPTDGLLLITEKDAEGRYRFPQEVRTGLTATIDGIRIFENTAITADQFLVGDFTEAQLLFRENAIVEMWLQDATNATTREVTMTINERLTLAVFNTGAFIEGGFANLLALGTA